MGYFSNLDIEQGERRQLTDRSIYPEITRLQHELSELALALQDMGVDLEEYARCYPGGIAGLYSPKARYAYYEVHWASDRTYHDLLCAAGEVAVSLEKVIHEEMVSNLSEVGELTFVFLPVWQKILREGCKYR